MNVLLLACKTAASLAAIILKFENGLWSLSFHQDGNQGMEERELRQSSTHQVLLT